MSHDATPTDDHADRREWAWTTEHGAPEWATTIQLVSWLARGELPAHTLVWKPGWAEWLPVLQVAELAAAFPGVTAASRRIARVAFDAAAAPPPVPVAQYPRLRLQARDVIRESSGPYPLILSRRLEPTEAVLVRYRDADHAQHELVTTQVPAAAMLKAAQAMQVSDTSRGHVVGRRPGASMPPPSLAPLALEEGSLSPPVESSSEQRQRPSRGYGRWIAFGTVAGAVLGVLSARDTAVPAAVLSALRPLSGSQAAAHAAVLQPASAALVQDPAPSSEAATTPPPAPSPAPPVAIAQPSVTPPVPRSVPPSVPPASTPVEPKALKPSRIRVKRSGEPAVLQALRVTKNNGFDRLVFEFRERAPGYRIEYVARPARDCDSGKALRIEGNARLELQFFPAQARDESGEPTVRTRELKPALSNVRELERTCDRNGVLTWVVGTASPQRFRAYEMTDPPRVVVQIEH